MIIPPVYVAERPTTIHKKPCAHCPSAHFPPDPESADIKANWSRAAQIDVVFPCAWRPDAMCRGVCDDLNITEEDLRKHAEESAT